MNHVLELLSGFRKSGKKAIAILIDPDKMKSKESTENLLNLIRHSDIDLVLVGGSLILESNFREVVDDLKKGSNVPIVLFPGSPLQIVPNADAVFFLSLISGRNPDLLIGQHVIAAPLIRKLNMEVIPTGYMLIDSGRATSVTYVSQTIPIPANKPDIASATALAGEMLGLKCIYMDAGSGADHPISVEMISAVRNTIAIPLVVGGGIRNEKQVRDAFMAGADVVVVGTAVENNPEILFSLSEYRNTK